jgi:hypothetical protein
MRDETLLARYYKGIAKITPELYEEVVERSSGNCEICGHNKRKAHEVHHIAGRRRVAHLNNLIHLCINHHKPPDGIHANQTLYNTLMKKYQQWCFDHGYTEEEVRYLLGTKSGRLF